MSTKTKITLNTDKIQEVAQQAGLVLMTAATTLGMLELSDHGNTRIVVPNQPNLALAGENSELNNPLRREREETGPHYVSYSIAQRTPSRAGKH